MDVSDYVPMFLAEAREQLQELNLAVVRIEETPDDQDAVEAAGDPATLCGMLGVAPGSEDGQSALSNILGCSYVNSLAAMIELEPRPPEMLADLAGAIMATVLATQADQTNLALPMDSRLIVEGEQCELTLIMLPSHDGIGELLTRLGLG